MRTMTLLLALCALLALPSCSGARLVPTLDAAVGWASTPELTGPAIRAGLGEYELGTLDPFGTAPGQAPAVSPEPDPALIASMADLAAKQAAAAARLDTLADKVESGELTPAAAEAIRAATARADALAGEARAAVERVTELEAKIAATPAPEAPALTPTEWTIGGIIAWVVGWLMFFLRKRGRNALFAQIQEARESAAAAIKRAIEAFDDLPEDAKPAEVREAIAKAVASEPPKA